MVAGFTCALRQVPQKAGFSVTDSAEKSMRWAWGHSTPSAWPMPANERVLGRVPQLANRRSSAFAEFDIELDGSNAVFVRVHELLSSSPRFPPHPRWVNIQSAPTLAASILEKMRLSCHCETNEIVRITGVGSGVSEVLSRLIQARERDCVFSIANAENLPSSAAGPDGDVSANAKREAQPVASSADLTTCRRTRECAKATVPDFVPDLKSG